eukprot:26787-Eustigmatos_ZCMA.PRE.1
MSVLPGGSMQQQVPSRPAHPTHAVSSACRLQLLPGHSDAVRCYITTHSEEAPRSGLCGNINSSSPGANAP